MGIGSHDTKKRPFLLDIIVDRYEQKSIIITPQYPPSNWYDMVGNPTIADTILVCTTHTTHAIAQYGENTRKVRPAKQPLYFHDDIENLYGLIEIICWSDQRKTLTLQ